MLSRPSVSMPSLNLSLSVFKTLIKCCIDLAFVLCVNHIKFVYKKTEVLSEILLAKSDDSCIIIVRGSTIVPIQSIDCPSFITSSICQKY